MGETFKSTSYNIYLCEMADVKALRRGSSVPKYLKGLVLMKPVQECSARDPEQLWFKIVNSGLNSMWDHNYVQE